MRNVLGNDPMTGGFDTARSTPPASERERAAVEQRNALARKNLSAFALDRFPDDLQAARRWRDEMCAVLGLGNPKTASGCCERCGQPRQAYRHGGHNRLCQSCAQRERREREAEGG